MVPLAMATASSSESQERIDSTGRRSPPARWSRPDPRRRRSSVTRSAPARTPRDPTGHQRGALLASLRDVGQHAFALPCTDQRAEACGRVERVAECQGRERRRGERDHLVAGARHDHARPRRARLPAVQHRVLHATGHGLLEGGIVEQHDGRLAAEFKRALDDSFTRERTDATPGGERTREAHHVEARVPDQGLAGHRARAVDDVEDAGRIRSRDRHRRAGRRSAGRSRMASAPPCIPPRAPARPSP